MNEQELALATELAAMEVACRDCDGKGIVGSLAYGSTCCTTCHGTGKVPLFAGVRDECSYCNGGTIKPDKRCTSPDECDCLCPTCRKAKGEPAEWGCCAGRGWTASDRLDVWLVAAQKAGTIPSLHWDPDDNWWHSGAWTGTSRIYVRADTPLLALFLALKAAVGGKS